MEVPARNKWVNGGLFVLLSIIWGSSFILMKLGMYSVDGKPLLSAYQVAAIRILSAGVVLLPFLAKSIQSISPSKQGYVVLSGILGSFLPAFLFCIAETKIDSALVGTLNALTPVFVIIVGALLYRTTISKIKLIGVFVAVIGCFLLLFSGNQIDGVHPGYAGLVLLATIFYGINVNLIRHKLQEVASMHIAAIAFAFLIIPAAFVLWQTDFFYLPLFLYKYIKATVASVLLGVAGTAIASVLFYVLVKRAGALFASTVTYGIPFVAILWGMLFGEIIGWLQIVSLLLILTGVYLTNK